MDYARSSVYGGAYPFEYYEKLKSLKCRYIQTIMKNKKFNIEMIK